MHSHITQLSYFSSTDSCLIQHLPFSQLICFPISLLQGPEENGNRVEVSNRLFFGAKSKSKLRHITWYSIREQIAYGHGQKKFLESVTPPKMGWNLIFSRTRRKLITSIFIPMDCKALFWGQTRVNRCYFALELLQTCGIQWFQVKLINSLETHRNKSLVVLEFKLKPRQIHFIAWCDLQLEAWLVLVALCWKKGTPRLEVNT